MAKILAIDAAAGTEMISKGSSSATVNFRIHYKILYMPDSGKMAEELPETPEIKAFTAVSEHTAVLDTDIIGENTIVRAACCVENIESTYINSRKISIKTAIRIDPTILNTNEEGICTGIAGLEDVQMQKSSITLSTIAENTTDTIVVDEDVELSSGKAAYKELLRTDAILADATYTVTGDKLQIRGNLEIYTLYISARPHSRAFQIIERNSLLP